MFDNFETKKLVENKWTEPQRRALEKIGAPGYTTAVVTGALGAGKTNVISAHAVLSLIRHPKDTLVVFCAYCEQLCGLGGTNDFLKDEDILLLKRVREDIIQSVGEAGSEINFDEQLLTIADYSLDTGILGRITKLKHKYRVFVNMIVIT